MSADIKFDEFLDAKGICCPLPILKTKKAGGREAHRMPDDHGRDGRQTVGHHRRC